MWVSILATHAPLIEELRSRACTLNGWEGPPPRITEARVNNDGYTTVAQVTLGTNSAFGYGIAVKGPEDHWDEEAGMGLALRRALNNGVMVLKQKVTELQKPYKEVKVEEPKTPTRKLTEAEIKDWLYRLGRDVSDYAAAIDHRLGS